MCDRYKSSHSFSLYIVIYKSSFKCILLLAVTSFHFTIKRKNVASKQCLSKIDSQCGQRIHMNCCFIKLEAAIKWHNLL